MRLLPLALVQCAVVIWLHFRTLQRNVDALRQYLVVHPPRCPGSGVWIRGTPGGYSFALCGQCVDALVSAPG